MAHPLANITVPSKSRHGHTHEVTIWRHPSGQLSTTCTCEHQLYTRDPAARCTHRRHVEERLYAAGFRSAPGGRLTTPDDHRAAWDAFWAARYP